MVYCHKCGFQNAQGASYCSGCGDPISANRKFEDNIKEFTDNVAKEAKVIADDLSKKVAPKPLNCSKCATKIYETDVYCWKCGDKRL
jgi:uncharacterized membrane protein YvbJ